MSLTRILFGAALLAGAFSSAAMAQTAPLPGEENLDPAPLIIEGEQGLQHTPGLSGADKGYSGPNDPNFDYKKFVMPVYADKAQNIIVPGNWDDCKVYRSKKTGRFFMYRGMIISVAGTHCPGAADSPGFYYVSGTLINDQMIMPDFGITCTITRNAGLACLSIRPYIPGEEKNGTPLWSPPANKPEKAAAAPAGVSATTTVTVSTTTTVTSATSTQ